ncbi:MAG: DUF2971 domain-containing protein [Thermoproteota archaeon]|nr:DUF2971 domain-containing protein [Thermoproteota archaeon]
MELAEFVSMLHRKALFFVKANKLRDPYEGIMPQFNNSILSTGYSKENQQPHSQEQSRRYIQKLPQIMIQQFQLYRELVLINPWHYNEYESAAMWNLYSHENAGIAIQSTTRKLSKCFDDNKEDTIWIGKVQYLDFSKDGANEWDNLIQAFVTKRKSFEYENEIRAVTCMPADANLSKESIVKTANREDLFFSSSPKDRVINPKDLTDKGKYVSADLQTLIEKVYIAPYAEPWFEEVLESLLSKYELNTTTVTKSDLYTIS